MQKPGIYPKPFNPLHVTVHMSAQKDLWVKPDVPYFVPNLSFQNFHKDISVFKTEQLIFWCIITLIKVWSHNFQPITF